jgi:hypothetical protein
VSWLVRLTGEAERQVEELAEERGDEVLVELMKLVDRLEKNPAEVTWRPDGREGSAAFGRTFEGLALLERDDDGDEQNIWITRVIWL